MGWMGNEDVAGAAGSSARLAFAGIAPVEAWGLDREERRVAGGDGGPVRRVSALALRGEMEAPFRWTIEPQGVATLDEGVGRAACRRGRFDAVTGASFDSAETRVEGENRSDGSYEVVARVTIEGLDLLGVVTADRIVAEVRGAVAAERAKGEVGSGPWNLSQTPFTPTGTEVVNLRILDAPVSFDSPLGCKIPIEGLGVLHLGELRLTPEVRRLTMLRLELSGRVRGELAAGIVEIGEGSSD